nr:PAS domain-containing protein [Methylorubrum extorquens]
MTGQSGHDQQGDGWVDILHPEDRHRAMTAWHTAWTHGPTFDTDFRILCADGSFRWYNCRAAPLLNGQGAVVEWLSVLLSIVASARFASPAARPVSEFTPALARSARAMLSWSILDLAEAADVSPSSVKRFEAEDGVRGMTRLAICRALEAEGLHFSVNSRGEISMSMGSAHRIAPDTVENGAYE